MEAVTQSTERYLAVFDACLRRGEASPAELSRARLEVTRAVAEAPPRGREAARASVERILDAVHELLQQWPDDARVTLELGAFDTLSVVLGEQADAAFSPEALRVARSARLLGILRVLEGGEHSKSELAARVRGREREGPATDSERSQMSRSTRELREAGLTVETRSGRERVVRLSPLGRSLIEAVDAGVVEGATTLFDPGEWAVASSEWSDSELVAEQG